MEQTLAPSGSGLRPPVPDVRRRDLRADRGRRAGLHSVERVRSGHGLRSGDRCRQVAAHRRRSRAICRRVLRRQGLFRIGRRLRLLRCGHRWRVAVEDTGGAGNSSRQSHAGGWPTVLTLAGTRRAGGARRRNQIRQRHLAGRGSLRLRCASRNGRSPVAQRQHVVRQGRHERSRTEI